MNVTPTIIEACALAAHEANRAYCRGIGDESQPAWDDAPDWQRASAREGVKGALAGATPEQSHESWLAHKLAEGWTYGPVKDPAKKEHPCMVPYAELPPEQRAKDGVFVDVVRAVARALGWAPAFALALLLAACSSGPAPSAPGAPPRAPSAAEIALQGPQKSADTLTLLSHAHDSARLGAALVAAETCPAGDRACAEARKREALEAFASAGAALEALVHVRRELFPAGPRAYGPDDEGVLRRLGLGPALPPERP